MNHVAKLPDYKNILHFDLWKKMNAFHSFLLGALIGVVAWGHGINYTPLSLFILFGYLLLDQRKAVWFLVLGYYLAASRGLLTGITTYYDSLVYGIGIWLAAGALNALPWAMIWSKDPIKRGWLLPLVLIILILPPFGFISWVNPMITAGYFFPGFGGFSFILLILFIFVLLTLHRYFASSIPMVLIGSIAFGDAPQIQDHLYEAVHSNFFYGTGETDPLKEKQRIDHYINIANASPKYLIVLPENALGYVDKNSHYLSAHLHPGKKVLAGANLRDPENDDMYDNVLVEITNDGVKTLYKQRVPVPIAMWTPFSKTGTKAYIDGDPLIYYNDQKIGVFICYEQLLTFTYFQTMYYEPDLLLGISNLWWAKGTSIGDIEKVHLELWGRLYGVPVIFSINT